MRTFLVAAIAFLMIAPARAETDIAAACYTECEASTNSNPEFKACLAQAADKADAALNTAYQELQNNIRVTAKEAEQKPIFSFPPLKTRRKPGSLIAIPTVSSRTSSRLAAPRWAASIQTASAR